MITYPVPPDTLWAVYQISTQQIIARNRAWPVEGGGEIPGLDADFVYLKQIPATEPDYDPRLFLLTEDETVDVENNELRQTYSTVSRSVVEAKINAENTEAVENQRHYSERERDKLLILGLGVLFRQVANQTLTTREQALKTRITSIAAKLWANDQRLRDIFTAIEGGQNPDLDAGWQPPA